MQRVKENNSDFLKISKNKNSLERICISKQERTYIREILVAFKVKIKHAQSLPLNNLNDLAKSNETIT